LSKYWFLKWKSIQCPGPIDNAQLLCEHGFIKIEYASRYSQLVEIPQSVWQDFVMLYGGGPALQSHNLIKCKECESKLIQLEQRRQSEKCAIQERDRTFLSKEGEHWYLLHVHWLRMWHEFINGGVVPGPISNSELLTSEGKPREGLVRAKHYRGVTKEVWQYFHEIYGGGPEILCSSLNIYDSSIQINK